MTSEMMVSDEFALLSDFLCRLHKGCRVLIHKLLGLVLIISTESVPILSASSSMVSHMVFSRRNSTSPLHWVSEIFDVSITVAREWM